ncbi:hypothetical protein BV898_20064, partial [Hypsibius exemplaris]
RCLVFELEDEYRREVCYRCRVSSPSGVVFSRCSGCKRAFYCSNEGQRNDWNDYHKEECRLLFRRPEYTQQRVGKVNTEFMKVDGKPVLTFIHVILAHKAILRLEVRGSIVILV